MRHVRVRAPRGPGIQRKQPGEGGARRDSRGVSVVQRRHRDESRCGTYEYVRHVGRGSSENNPVKAGLAATPGEFPWSSAGIEMSLDAARTSTCATWAGDPAKTTR